MYKSSGTAWQSWLVHPSFLGSNLGTDRILLIVFALGLNSKSRASTLEYLLLIYLCVNGK
jgi:hypothetical protein